VTFPDRFDLRKVAKLKAFPKFAQLSHGLENSTDTQQAAETILQYISVSLTGCIGTLAQFRAFSQETSRTLFNEEDLDSDPFRTKTGPPDGLPLFEDPPFLNAQYYDRHGLSARFAFVALHRVVQGSAVLFGRQGRI
jgi:hypothetical protein